MSGMSRRKGTKGEQMVATLYREQGINAVRVPNSGGLDTKGDLLGIPGTHAEVKMTGKIEILKWMAQAEAEAPPGQTPAVHFRLCTRARSTGWYVCVPFDDWVDMLKARQA